MLKTAWYLGNEELLDTWVLARVLRSTMVPGRWGTSWYLGVEKLLDLGVKLLTLPECWGTSWYQGVKELLGSWEMINFLIPGHWGTARPGCWGTPWYLGSEDFLYQGVEQLDTWVLRNSLMMTLVSLCIAIVSLGLIERYRLFYNPWPICPSVIHKRVGFIAITKN